MQPGHSALSTTQEFRQTELIDKKKKIQDYVSKLTHREAGVRKSAAMSLSHLAFNTENHIIIAEAEAISPLVNLLSDRKHSYRYTTGEFAYYYDGEQRIS